MFVGTCAKCVVRCPEWPLIHYNTHEDFFSYPVPSRSVNTVLISNLSDVLSVITVDQIKWKACKLPTVFPDNGVYIVSPLPFHN